MLKNKYSDLLFVYKSLMLAYTLPNTVLAENHVFFTQWRYYWPA